MAFLCFHRIWGFITYNHELSNTFLFWRFRFYGVLPFSSKHQEAGKADKSLIIHAISAFEAIFVSVSKVLCHHFLSSKYQIFFDIHCVADVYAHLIFG